MHLERTVTPSVIVSALLGVRVALGAAVQRQVVGYEPIVLWSLALLAAWSAQAVVDALQLPIEAVAMTRVTIASLGAWAVALRVIEGRSTRVPIAIGGAVIALTIYPGLSAHGPVRDGLWILGLAGAWWSVQRGLRRERVARPGLPQLVTLVYATVDAACLTVGMEEGWIRAVPALVATGAALIAEASWLVGARRTAANVGNRDEQLRAAERVGDLVDLAQAVRGRGGRGAGAQGSARKP